MVIDEIREELSRRSYDAPKQKHPVDYTRQKFYGFKLGVIREMSAAYYPQVKDMPKDELFVLCEELQKSGYFEEKTIAFDWVYRRRKEYTPADFTTFERWVHNYLADWCDTDDFCNHTMGTFVEMYPQYIANLKEWAKSDNQWVRRAAAVTLILPARSGKFLDDVFEIADILLLDKEDLVQKGYG